MKVIKGDVLKDALRNARERECFPVVNRGQVWYNMLTEEQRDELTRWYLAWLDVTETKVIPIKPGWLDKKLSREEILW